MPPLVTTTSGGHGTPLVARSHHVPTATAAVTASHDPPSVTAAIALGLVAAVGYGVGDFLGGVAGRRLGTLPVAVVLARTVLRELLPPRRVLGLVAAVATLALLDLG